MSEFLSKYPATIVFPPATETLVEGVIFVGGELTVGNLYAAYTQGIFPWPHPGYPMLWFCPEKRGILDFSDFHVPALDAEHPDQRGSHYAQARTKAAVHTLCHSRAHRKMVCAGRAARAQGRYHRSHFRDQSRVF